MLLDIPKKFSVKKEETDAEIARTGMIAELDAVNLYEQMAEMAGDKSLKNILLSIAKEEKTHMGEFQAMLLKFDKQQAKELEEGKKEAEAKS